MKLATFDPNAGGTSSSNGGERVSAKDLIGAALLIKVNKHNVGVTTKFGEKDAIDIDVCGITSGKIATDVRWFNGAVVDALAPYVGQVVPVKLAYTQGSGPFPYIVAEALSEIELQAAQRFLNERNPFGQDQGLEPVASPLPEASGPGPILVPSGGPTTDAPRW